jgi:signal peptidase
MVLKYILSGFTLLAVFALILAYSGGSAVADIYTYNNESPSDSVSEEQILVYNDKVILDLQNIKWVTYTNTGSMKPVIDEGANGLEVVPKFESELKVGDIVSYNASWNEELVVHRIVGMGEDVFGTYYILKGDNNQEHDSGKIRFEQIKYKTIAIIY